jgi:hypothetical protein
MRLGNIIIKLIIISYVFILKLLFITESLVGIKCFICVSILFSLTLFLEE